MVSCRTFLVIGCLLIHATNGLPQRKSSESPVIFIDFDYQGKPGEKTLRSLDQVAYEKDGVVNRARSNLRDSYGNPVEYDTLEAVDSDKAGKNHPDPNKFIIPGYASGILQPHEVPTRSSVDVESSRKIDDDGRIHFIDPLQNAYQNTNKASQVPSPSLSAPPGPNFANDNNQPAPTPINIPRPNIDLPETPQTPIDDPLNHVLTPPQDNTASKPSFSLQAPGGNNQPNSFIQDLVPPQIPSEGQSVFIPRPNLDISETPIDNSNGPLNQGLLPPSDGPSIKNSPPTLSPFLNPNQNGNPVIITDTSFAPKPSNGLLPPKDVFQNDINFNSPDTSSLTTTVATPSNNNKFSGFGGSPGVLGNDFTNKASGPGSAAPTQQSNINVPTTNKYSGTFGGAPGVLGQPGNNLDNKISGVGSSAPTQQSNNNVPPPNKFSGSFGGAQGVLGGKGPATNQQNQIPVTIVQGPFPKPQQGPAPTQTFNSQTPKPANNKYQGNFGGSPGVLVSDSQFDRVVPSAASQAQPNLSFPPTAPTFASPSAAPVLNNRFPGTFDGVQDITFTSPNQATPTQSLAQLPQLSNNFPVAPKENTIQKYTGQFGGAPGILKPYDNQ